MWDALFDERMGLYSYNFFLALPDRSLSGPSPAKLTTAFYCLIWDSSNLEGQVPICIFPTRRVARLYPRALGSHFVASYDSQGYGGSILTLLHTVMSTPRCKGSQQGLGFLSLPQLCPYCLRTGYVAWSWNWPWRQAQWQISSLFCITNYKLLTNVVLAMSDKLIILRVLKADNLTVWRIVSACVFVLHNILM
jgi:hypothetical protein